MEVEIEGVIEVETEEVTDHFLNPEMIPSKVRLLTFNKSLLFHYLYFNHQNYKYYIYSKIWLIYSDLINGKDIV